MPPQEQRMVDNVQFRLVDAFAETPFTGNPAGVVLDADRLNDVQMQRIAREINASETAFLSRANDLHRPTLLRWFTPTTEVDFCGHATLAAAHAWSETVGVGYAASEAEPRLEFETAAGLLSLHAEWPSADADGPLWWLQMPDPSLRPDNTNPMRTCELLGLTHDDLEPGVPIMRTRDDDLIFLIRSWQRLNEMRPDFGELTRWSERHRIRGYCVATLNTLSKATTVHSRFFAPAAGVPEDPVTGSVHGPLATLLVANELVPHARGRSALNCMQGQPGGRAGLVRAIVESTPQGYRVSIAARCHTTLTGVLRVPPEK
jgi:trans-2,3-dihydro-3-hydroxyanthranilate isomerase